MMAMYDGDGDITDSNWRMTVEKRDAGVVAWRFIAGRPGGATQIDTEGSSERVPVNFNPGTTYFWRATWGGGFDLNIFEGGVGGNRIYAFGKSMGATYNPQPHVAYLGSVVGRAGPDSASVPGVTYRNVYIADQSKPRPASLGTAIDREHQRGPAHQEPRHPPVLIRFAAGPHGPPRLTPRRRAGSSPGPARLSFRPVFIAAATHRLAPAAARSRRAPPRPSRPPAIARHAG